jgi:tetratricopeptide (TPR) repeat protein
MPPPELPGESDPRVPKDMLTRHLIGGYHYMRGLTYERLDWLRAREELEKAAAAAPDNDVLFYNLGLIYGRNGLLDDALAAFQRCRAINPRPLASGSHPLASDRIAEARAEIERIRAVESALAGSPALAGLPEGSGERYAATALLLENRGERVAARGARLRALEAGAGVTATRSAAPR